MINNPSPDLKTLMLFIGERYIFDEQSYPGIGQLSPKQRALFVVRHSALHVMKSAGVLAAQAESGDHGNSMDAAELKIATTKTLVNALKLAQELGMTAEDLAAQVPGVMRSR